MRVYHMSGAGNDFAVIDARGMALDFSAMAKELCKRTGADGFMAVDLASDADFTLHFYNADGSRGEMCGNGSRCICRFACDHGIALSHMTVHTDAGLIEGWRLSESTYRVKLNNPGIIDLHRTPDAAYVELGDPGIPHGIVELPDLSFDLLEQLRPRAKALRYAPAFPKGANITFFTPLSGNEVRVLTYERGVEDYTLACGTGCGSLAVTLHAQGRLPEGRLICHNRGGDLSITLESDGKCVQSLYLEGPTEYLNDFEI